MAAFLELEIAYNAGMLFEGATAEARFLAWQARQECARSHDMIRAARADMTATSRIIALTQGLIYETEQRIRANDIRCQDAERFGNGHLAPD